MIKKKVLIFGASGQIGRYCIRRLVKDNYKVVALTRNKHQKAYILKTQAPIGYLDIEETDIFNEEKITKFISETDICINLIGILFEKGKRNTFENIHNKFPKLLSKICSKHNKKLIHLSALGLEDAKDSLYASSKLNGEESIKNNLTSATILKPSIVYSVDDKFTTKFMSMLSLLPIFPLYYNGATKFCPIHASDVSEVIFKVISNEIYSKSIEVIGPEVLTFKEILQKLLIAINKKRVLLPLPLFIAKASASIFQLLPTPLITNDQLNLLKYDNIKSKNGVTNFDIGVPSKIFFDKGIKQYAYNWREGGKFSLEENN